jgi:hypothetical protein
MVDSERSMLGHVALRLRLVYESTSNPDSGMVLNSDVPGWALVGLLPEDSPAGPVDDSIDLDPTSNCPDARSDTPVANIPARLRARRRIASELVELTLDRDEADGYYLNLTSPEPSLFVLLRLPDVASATAAQASDSPPEAVSVTASYSEAARWMDGGMVVVRTVLPGPFLAWIAEFAEHHFQLEERKKPGRNRPSFQSRKQFGDQANAALDELKRKTKPRDSVQLAPETRDALAAMMKTRP